MLASFWDALPRAVAGLWGWFEQPGGFGYQERAQGLPGSFNRLRLRHHSQVHFRHSPLERLPGLPDTSLTLRINRFRLHARLPGLALVRGDRPPGLEDLLGPLRDRDGPELLPLADHIHQAHAPVTGLVLRPVEVNGFRPA